MSQRLTIRRPSVSFKSAHRERRELALWSRREFGIGQKARPQALARQTREGCHCYVPMPSVQMANGIARAVARGWRIPLWGLNFPKRDCAPALEHQQWHQKPYKTTRPKLRHSRVVGAVPKENPAQVSLGVPERGSKIPRGVLGGMGGKRPRVLMTGTDCICAMFSYCSVELKTKTPPEGPTGAGFREPSLMHVSGRGLYPAYLLPPPTLGKRPHRCLGSRHSRA